MRLFWQLTFARAISVAGNTFLYVAVPWALVETTGSGLLAVLSMAAQTTPYLASPFLGAFIDRHDRRFTFALAEVVQAVSVALIPLFLAIHQVALVFVALFVMGLGKAVADAAGDYGLIPALVPDDRLEQASGWYNAVQLLARLAGPALAGLTLAALGTVWALEIDAATFLITLVAAVVLPAVGAPSGQEGKVSLSALLREGVAYFRSRRDLQWLTAVCALYNLGVGGLEPTLLTLGTGHWQWSSATLGMILSVGAAAAALGAWLSPRAPGAKGDQRRRISVWMAVTALGSLVLLFGSPLVVTAGFIVLCLGEGGFNATTMALRQREIPAELSGRINTIIRTFIIGAIPVSSLLLGLTVSQSLPVPVLLPVAVGAVSASLLWTLVAARRHSQGPARRIPHAGATPSTPRSLNEERSS